MGFKIKKTVNGETVWESIKAKKYTASKPIEYTGTLPITINADGNALLDYQIYGNTEQTGTPTPENPIMSNGCGERTENLWDEEYLNGYYTSSNTFVSANNQICSKSKIAVKPNTAYWLGVTSNSGTAFLGVLKYNKNAEFIERENTESYKGNGVVFTTDANTYYININFGAYYGSVYNGDIIIAESSTLISYEPYGYKLPILSNSTVTNIYLGEVETTRKIKKLVLTGNESGWGKSQVRTGSFYFHNPEVFTCIPSFGCCNVAQNAQRLSDYNYGKMYAEDPHTINLWLFDTNLSTDDFKSYLAAQYAAGTPVTVWYVLAEPETAVVNEPLMKIGDYTDTVSMEQAGVSIPTNNDSTVIDYDGTLKPSKMYIKYNSWSGWSDIDNYKMDNGDWTQEAT